MTGPGRSAKYFVPIAWAFWIILVVWVSYQTRFWINNDTIGSLDVARSVRGGEFAQAVNAYWGVGFGLLLSLLPLDGIHSWFQIHLLMGILVFGAQFFIYLTLLKLGVRRTIATALSIIWGASNYATGGALFLTSDILLCFWGSLYLYFLVKTVTGEKLYSQGNLLLLGLIHGLAWLTKMVAAIGLLLIYIPIYLKYTIDCLGLLMSKRYLMFKSIASIMVYLLPIFVLIIFWSMGTYYKYGRFTIGDTGAYNYALYVNHSKELAQAEEVARHRLPQYGTYWWSDISLSLAGWDHRIHFDINAQFKNMRNTITSIFSGPMFRDGAVVLLIIFTGLVSCPILIYKRINNYDLLIIMAMSSIIMLALYSSINNLLARFIPFAAIFSLPANGVILEKIFIRDNRILRNLSVALLILFGLHGFGSMIYASMILAPGGEHFAIAEEIRAHTLKGEEHGPVGVFLASPEFMYHHGVISYLLQTQTAEIKPVEGDSTHFTANFRPQFVVMALFPNVEAPGKIAINRKKYQKIYSCFWGKAYKKTRLTVYQSR